MLQGMHDETQRAVEFFADVTDHIVLFLDEDRATEVIAEQHRTDRQPADRERGNGEQDAAAP